MKGKLTYKLNREKGFVCIKKGNFRLTLSCPDFVNVNDKIKVKNIENDSDELYFVMHIFKNKDTLLKSQYMVFGDNIIKFFNFFDNEDIKNKDEIDLSFEMPGFATFKLLKKCKKINLLVDIIGFKLIILDDITYHDLDCIKNAFNLFLRLSIREYNEDMKAIKNNLINTKFIDECFLKEDTIIRSKEGKKGLIRFINISQLDKTESTIQVVENNKFENYYNCEIESLDRKNNKINCITSSGKKKSIDLKNVTYIICNRHQGYRLKLNKLEIAEDFLKNFILQSKSLENDFKNKDFAFLTKMYANSINQMYILRDYRHNFKLVFEDRFDEEKKTREIAKEIIRLLQKRCKSLNVEDRNKLLEEILSEK